MIIAVISIFIIWFLVSVLYIFKPTWLGRYKGPLHSLGWVSAWSMFIESTNTFKGHFNILYLGIHPNGESEKWNTLSTEGWKFSAFILGHSARKQSFLRYCVRNSLKHYFQQSEQLNDSNLYFGFLCQFVVDRKKNENITCSKVRLEYYKSGAQEPIVLESDNL